MRAAAVTRISPCSLTGSLTWDVAVSVAHVNTSAAAVRQHCGREQCDAQAGGGVSCVFGLKSTAVGCLRLRTELSTGVAAVLGIMMRAQSLPSDCLQTEVAREIQASDMLTSAHAALNLCAAAWCQKHVTRCPRNHREHFKAVCLHAHTGSRLQPATAVAPSPPSTPQLEPVPAALGGTP